MWFVYIMRTNKTGAPYVAMETEVVERVMQIAEVGKDDVFYELGSGDGRLVISAALRGATAYGIEIDYLRVLYSKIWIFFLGLANAKIIHKNIFEIDLGNASVIHAYLLPATNKKLEEKLARELKKGTRVVSVGFEFPSWKPVKIDPRGTIYGPIYLYKI